jgi:glycosyltransferase involved in cell wall biosynthesis
MKIAIVAEQYPPDMGGVARSVERIAKNLNKEGLDIVVITYDYQKEDFFEENLSATYVNEERNAKGLVIYRIGPISKKFMVLEPGLMASQRRNFYHALLKVLDKEKPDLIQGFCTTKSGFFAVMAGKKIGIPSIVCVRGNDISRDVFDFSKFGAIKWTIDNSSFITFVNDISQEDGSYFIDKGKRHKIVLNSCDFEHKELPEEDKIALKDKLGIKRDAFIIGFSGAIREKKGVQHLLEAFNRVAKENPIAHLLIVGDFVKDKENKPYQDYIKKNNLGERVTLTGMVPFTEVDKYYNLIDIICMPSTNDGLSNSLLEGLKAGIPTIASSIFKGILEDNKHALLFEAGNSKELYDKIMILIGNSELRDLLSKNAQQLIKEKFSTDRETREYIEIYKDLLK